MASKFYWIKLKNSFFKRHDIQIIEAMPNGKDYVLFYLKLLVESVAHEGRLRFSDTIPYNETMLATITNTNVDVVKRALDIFRQLQIIDIQDDQTIYMIECEKMIGCETEWAEKKRQYRNKQRTLSLKCQDEIRQEKEREIDKEKELDKEIDKEREDNYIKYLTLDSKSEKNPYGEFKNVWLSDDELDALYNENGIDNTVEAIKLVDQYLEKTGKKYGNYYLAIKEWGFDAVEERKSKKNIFNDFEQRKTSYSHLEEKLCSM